MRRPLLAIGLAALPNLFPACGGQTGSTTGTSSEGGSNSTAAGGQNGPGGVAAGGSSSFPDDGGAGSSGQDPGEVPDAFSEYVDPGCPVAAMASDEFACDPNASENPCGPGLACYPFVQYPTGTCSKETYGASCVSAGDGGQGDTCEAGCQAGFLCVISGQGTQCVRICDLSKLNACPDGLLCSQVDIPGVGGCI